MSGKYQIGKQYGPFIIEGYYDYEQYLINLEEYKKNKSLPKPRLKYLCRDVEKNNEISVKASCTITRDIKVREKTKNKIKNKYILTGEFGIGYTPDNYEFYFDLEDFDKIKNYAWYRDKKNGYIKAPVSFFAKINQRNIYLHRLVMNASAEKEIDHINRKRCDCRKNNLRLATSGENKRNKTMSSKNKYGFIGIRLESRRSKWTARIKINNKEIYLGTFENKEDAIKARLEAEAKYFGEFAPQIHLFEQYGIQLPIKKENN